MADAPTLNPFKISQKQLDKSAAKLNLDPQVHELLREPMRTLEVHFPVRMDDGDDQDLHRIPRAVQRCPWSHEGWASFPSR